MWDSANEVSRILGVWRCAGMRLRWEAAVGGRRVAWREADCNRKPPQAGRALLHNARPERRGFSRSFRLRQPAVKTCAHRAKCFWGVVLGMAFPQNWLVVDRNRRYARIRLRLRPDFLGVLSKSPGHKSPRVSQSIQGPHSGSHIGVFCPRMG